MTTGDERAAAEALPSEAKVFLQHILGLWPGKRVPVFRVHEAEPGDVTNWATEDLGLLIDEGRRQLDRQGRDLEQIRGRAQYVLTATLGLVVLLFAGARTMAEADSVWPFLVWSLAIGSTVLGLLGTAAVVVASKDMGVIDATRLSQQQQGIRSTLAAAYARVVRVGENTLATHLTVFRDAVLLVLLGAALYGAAWLIAVL
jgi:hypothetical protein